MVRTILIVAGVVIADDTIVIEASLAPILRDAEVNFEFRLFHDPAFRSPILTYQLDSSSTLIATLAHKIPPASFQPVCIPPKDYVNKMVKSKSCKRRQEQMITQVIISWEETI